MAKDYIINGRKVKMWYTRGGARIPIYEDGGIGKNQNKKILSNKELSNMTWDEVVQKNTDYYNEKSIYDFEGIKKGKYAYEEGWRDNKASGVIKQEDLDKLATRDEWLSANKYKKVYNSVKEATEDPSSKINKYIERKTGKNPALSRTNKNKDLYNNIKQEKESDDALFENAYHKAHKETNLKNTQNYQKISNQYAKKYGEEERQNMFDKSQNARRKEVNAKKSSMQKYSDELDKINKYKKRKK